MGPRFRARPFFVGVLIFGGGIFFRTTGLDIVVSSHPRLAPWAAFFRRFAAGQPRTAVPTL